METDIPDFLVFVTQQHKKWPGKVSSAPSSRFCDPCVVGKSGWWHRARGQVRQRDKTTKRKRHLLDFHKVMGA
jgi:hypothetical protein